MRDNSFDRRDFLKSAVIGSAAAATGAAALPQPAQAQQTAAPGSEIRHGSIRTCRSWKR